MTPKIKDKLLLPRLVLNSKLDAKSFFSPNKHTEGRYSLKNSPRNISTSEMDMSESKSTSQPNSRLYSRKTKLSEIDEKNELLKAKLNKVECSHVESKSFSTAMKNPLSQEDSI